MIARLSLLPDAARRVIAGGAVLLGVAAPVLVCVVLILSLIERSAERDAVMAETTRLHAALQARLDALGPSGPAPALTAELALAALIEIAGAITDQLDDAPVSVAVGAPQDAQMRGVSEIRLAVALIGAPDAVADALARIETGEARVFLFTLGAEDAEQVEARITFTRTVRDPDRESAP